MSVFLIITSVSYYISYVINLFGLIQNILTFVIFSRKPFANSSIGFYGKALVVFDSFMAFNFACGVASVVMGGIIIHRVDILCRLHFLITVIVSPIPGWILVVFSIDQMLSVCVSATRFGFVRQRWFQYMAIAITSLAHCGIYYPVYFDTYIKNTTVRNETFEWCDCYSKAMPIVFVIFSIGMPLAIILFTSSFIVRVLIKSRRKVTISNIATMQNRPQRDLQYAFNLIALNILYIAFALPCIVLYLYPIEDVYLNMLLKTTTYALYYLHFASHFWIFVFVNAKFRNEMLIMLRLADITE